MKFLLVLSVCSATFQTCFPPVTNDVLYDSHFDCATAGYLNAIQEIGELEVNNRKLFITFKCNPISDA